jgi:DNA topoisomerase-3
LDACQALYETHRLLTYPRSDSSYLPEGQHAQAIAVLAAIATNVPSLAELVAKADRSRKSRAWNDKKVTAHHAVIPTLVAKPEASLSAAERGVYDLVARRYLAQFQPLYEFHETKIELSVEGERLRASGRETITDGWRAVLPKAPEAEAEEEGPTVDDEVSGQVLPVVRQGEAITCADIVVAEHHTKPPKPFTDATLIQAMTGIARFVDDPKIKQLLREADGIGTPATQAQIIQTLFDRKFIEKRGRHVQSTVVGRTLIQTLPALATKPDMTALWEAAMRRIGEGQMPLSSFLDAVIQQLRELVASGRALVALRVPTLGCAKSRNPTRDAGLSRRSRRAHG